MKIVAFRHGEKQNGDIQGNLSSHGKWQSIETGKKIAETFATENVIYMGTASSQSQRVKDTASGVLVGMETKDMPLDKVFGAQIIEKAFAGLSGLPDESNDAFTARRKELCVMYPEQSPHTLQDQVALEYMQGKLAGPTPTEIAQPRLQKFRTLSQLLQKSSEKHYHEGHEKLIGVATHQTINESILIALCGGFEQLPTARQEPLGYAEEIYYDLPHEQPGKLIVTFRGVEKEFLL